MSSDEFDPQIERLFARTPQMADAAAFAATVEDRLASGTRLRTVALSAAGLVGGFIAVRESLNLQFNLGGAESAEPASSLSFGMQSATADAGSALQGMLGQVGLGDMGLGSMAGMQLFWMVTAVVVTLASAAVVKLSQQS
jgi:hypothetical protein